MAGKGWRDGLGAAGRGVLDVLVEVADVAADLVPRLDGEGDDGHEAEGEPLPVRLREISASCATSVI